MSDALQRVKLLQDKGILFEPNQLPDSINQLLVDLCTIVVQQESVINDLVLSIAKIKNEIMQNKSEIVKMNVSLTEVSGAQALVQSMAAGLKNLGEDQAKTQASVKQVGRENQRAIEELHIKFDQNDMELRDLINELKGEDGVRVPSTFEKSDDKPVIIDNQLTDIAPLVRGCYRESRRVDVLNEDMCNMKLDLDGGLKVVSQCNEGVQQFEHHLHDLGWNLMQTRALSSDRTRFFVDSIRSLEDAFGDVWELLEGVGSCIAHGMSSVGSEVERIVAILQKIYPRQIPLTSSVDDSVAEAAEWTDAVKAKKLQFEGSREKFLEPPVDMTEDPMIRKGSGETKGCLKIDEEAAVQQSLVQIRRKMNELAQGLTSVGSDVRSLQNQTRQKLDGKIDVKVAERMFEKLEAMIGQASKKRTASPTQKRVTTTEVIRERSHDFYDRVYTGQAPRTKARTPASARRPKTSAGRVMSQNVADPPLF